MKRNLGLSVLPELELLWEKRLGLTALAVLTLVLSAGVSLLMPTYFRATTMVYPARTSTLYLNESSYRRGNISDFGEELEAQQLLEIITSREMLSLVAKANHLLADYGLDGSNQKDLIKLEQLWAKFMSAKRTRYNAIQISYADRDPHRAAQVANSISAMADTLKNRMIRERAGTALAMVQAEEDRMAAELKQLSDRIEHLQLQGLLTELERASLYEAYGQALRDPNRSTTQELRKQIDVNRKWANEFDLQRRNRDLLVDQLSRLRAYKWQIQSESSVELAQKFVIHQALPPLRKAYPVRWLIVAGSLVGVMLFAMVAILLLDRLGLKHQP